MEFNDPPEWTALIFENQSANEFDAVISWLHEHIGPEDEEYMYCGVSETWSRDPVGLLGKKLITYRVTVFDPKVALLILLGQKAKIA